MSAGSLTLAATPIGAHRDASLRLIDHLTGVDVIAAEDTRRLRTLCRRLDVEVSCPMVSYYEHNEATRSTELVQRMLAGERVLLVTDAGMPSISDPGYRLVSAAVQADLPVTCLPGPSAVPMALALSGMPVDRFCFEGFLPRKAGQRDRAVRALSAETRTMVFFEAPHRLAAMLTSLVEVFGEQRTAAVCRELTKTYEEVKRGHLADLAAWAQQGVRGEITVVVAGSTAAPDQGADLGRLAVGIQERVAAGERLKDVCREVAASTGLSSKQLYDAVLALR